MWVLEMHFDGEDSSHKKWESWEAFFNAEKAVKAFQKFVNKGHGNVRIVKYVPETK